MRERPILFGPNMVRALLAGTKTQTRRVLRDQPDSSEIAAHGRTMTFSLESGFGRNKCSYGVPGDTLWVREAWKTTAGLDKKNATEIAAACAEANYPKPWAPLEYTADGARDNWVPGFDGEGPTTPGRQRLARFMPRWASRITLRVTDVRVQRVQEISEEDARAEGATFHDGRGIGHSGWRHDSDHGFVYATARDSFGALWQSINGDREGCSWASNPFVWCVSFSRVMTGEDGTERTMGVEP